jgi:hypothetical protein
VGNNVRILGYFSTPKGAREQKKFRKHCSKTSTNFYQAIRRRISEGSNRHDYYRLYGFTIKTANSSALYTEKIPLNQIPILRSGKTE